MKTLKAFGSAIVAIVLSAGAQAQSFNLDVNVTTGAGAGTPSVTYGAASGQVGFWQVLPISIAANAAIPLTEIGGGLTGVTFTSNTTLNGFGSLTNGNPTGDNALLLADVWDLGSTTAPPRVFTIAGLANGQYDVYTYAMAPDSGAFVTGVNVNGLGVQQVGGAYAGSFALGITHSLHSVNVTNGQIVVTTTNVVSFGSIAGFQIVQVPAPGALALLGMAGLVGSRRRRA